LQPGDELVNGNDANPMNVIFEVMTNTDWGLSIPGSDIDLANFRASAATLAAEGNGVSWLLDSATRASEVVGEIERQIDGTVYLDRSDGLFKVALIREVTSPVGLPVFDVSNVVEIEDFSRTAYEETTNEARARYISRAKDYVETYASAQDLANVQIQQHTVHVESQWPGVKDDDLANSIVWRELRTLSWPLSQGVFIANRDAEKMNIGDAFVLDWAPLGIAGLICRVKNLDLGNLQKNQVRVDFIQAIFSAEAGSYTSPPGSLWTRPSQDALPADPEFLIETPYGLTQSVGIYVGAVAGRPSGQTIQYEINADLAGGVSYSPLSPPEDLFTPVGTLAAALDRGETNGFQDATGFIVDGVADLDELVSATAAELEAGQNVCIIDSEVLLFSTVTDLGGNQWQLSDVIRGALDSIPAAHSINAPVYFISYGLGNVGLRTSDGNVTAKLLTETLFDKLTLGEASQLTIATGSRAAKAYPPANVQINAGKTGGGNFPTLVNGSPLAITWANRDKFSQPFATAWDDASIQQENFSGFNVRVIERVGFTTVAEASAIPGAGFNAQGYADDELTDLYRVQVESVNQAGVSQTWEVDFTVQGYGYGYGLNYGGESLGVILKPGDTPAVIPPVPGLDQESRLIIALSGTFSAADKLYVSVSFRDSTTNQNTSEFYTLNGSGKASLADFLSELAGLVASDFPAGRVSTTQTAGQLIIASVYGVVSGSVQTDAAAVQIVTEQAASNGTPGRVGISTVDLWVEDSNGNEQLAPAYSTEYVAGGVMVFRFNVNGITYDARQAIDRTGTRQFSIIADVPDLPGEPSGGYEQALFSNDTGPIVNYPILFQALRAKLSEGLGDFVESVNWNVSPTDPKPSARPGIRIQMRANYIIGEMLYATTDKNTPSTFATAKLLAKPNVDALPSYPSFAPKIVGITFTTTYTTGGSQLQPVVSGDTYRVTLAGTLFSYTTASQDAGDSPYRDGVYANLANAIQGAGYTVTFETLRRPSGVRPGTISDPGALLPATDLFVSRMIVRGNSNANYSATASASAGVIVDVTQQTVEL